VGNLFDPSKVSNPIGLLAILGFITALSILATIANSQLWPLAMLFGIAFLAGICLLLIPRLRDALSDDSGWEKLRLERQTFKDFQPQVQQEPSSTGDDASRSAMSPTGNTGNNMAKPATTTQLVQDWERNRIGLYQRSQGIFLTHTWRPSSRKDQTVDMVISLRQHRTGPVTAGEVEIVEYWLGPRFSRQPIVKTRSDASFDLDVSVFGPVLCLARITLTNGEVIEVDRYLDFKATDDSAFAEAAFFEVMRALPQDYSLRQSTIETILETAVISPDGTILLEVHFCFGRLSVSRARDIAARLGGTEARGLVVHSKPSSQAALRMLASEPLMGRAAAYEWRPGTDPSGLHAKVRSLL
jgi:hypothetical protein